MSTFYLKFGLGGVQEFISQARKVRDLVAGSELVADLVKIVGETALRYERTRLLLPAKPETNESWPHQFVIEYFDTIEEEVKRRGREMESAVKDAWQKRAVYVFNARKGLMSGFWTAGVEEFCREAATWLEVYWVAIRTDGNTRDQAFNELTARYDDRRYTRTFEAFPLTSTRTARWVCTLCGQRPSVIPRRSKRKPTRLLGDEELLCAVCLTKRHHSIGRQASTHTFARYRFLTDPIFDEVRQSLSKESSGHELLEFLDAFEEFDVATADSVDVTSGAVTDESPDESLLAARTIYDKLRADGEAWNAFNVLSPYYGIIVLDGDEMGKWLTGAKFDFEDSTQLRVGLSKSLQSFSSSVKSFLAQYVGTQLVYSGGDDAFVIVPLDHALPVLSEMHRAWKKAFADLPLSADDARPSMTLHLSIVHAKEPLQPAVREAFEHLHQAKEARRDCFSVLVDSRGGAPSAMLAAWQELDSFKKAVEAFSNWRSDDLSESPTSETRLAREKSALPDRLGRSALMVAPAFFYKGRIALTEALRTELRRLHVHSAAGDETSDNWGSMVNWLMARATNTGGFFKDSPRDKGLDEELYTEALKVVLFLARELNWSAKP